MLIIHSALVLVRIHFLCGSSLSTRVISVNGGGLPALRKAAYHTCNLVTFCFVVTCCLLTSKAAVAKD